jgi:hypothetical protein
MVHILAAIEDFDVVTPNDSTDLPKFGRVRALWVGATGDVNVIMLGDASETAKVLPGLAAGIWHPMNVKRVLSTSTTATDIRVGY